MSSPAWGSHITPITSHAVRGGLGQHLPPARAAILAEVCAWLAGGQLQQLRPFPLPLLLRVHQP